MMKHFFCTALLILITQFLIGQVHEAPLGGDWHRTKSDAYLKNTDTLQLPFFDDFSDYKLSTNPSELRWINTGGVFINNTFSFNPPTLGIASFDGLQANGDAYAFGNSNGHVDTLTSKPIDLSPYRGNNLDRIAFSFYWQKSGVAPGVVPNPARGDSLNLYFLNKDTIWERVWPLTDEDFDAQEDLEAGDTFQLVFIPVLDSAKYFYNGFQFRFHTYGSENGARDVWNIDYIYLDTARNTNNIQDFAYAKEPTGLLKNYYNMPVSHFLSNIENELSDTVFSSFNNLTNSTNLIADSSAVLFAQDFRRALSTSAQLDSTSIETSTIGFIESNETIDAYYVVNKSIIANNLDPFATSNKDTLSIDLKMTMVTPVDRASSNDEIVSNTTFSNFFALDDGTAESVIFLSEPSSLSQAFYTNHSDSITAVDIYWPTRGLNTDGESIDLQIWSSLDGVDGANSTELLFSSGTGAFDGDTLNGFFRYNITPTLIEAGTFYVGYSQQRNVLLHVGLDKSRNTLDQSYFSVNGENWGPAFPPSTTGNLMIRPVFSDPEPVGFEELVDRELNADFYPNPTQDRINLFGDIKEAAIYDLIGNKAVEVTFNSESIEKNIDLSMLPNGIYFLHLRNGLRETTKKIVLQR